MSEEPQKPLTFPYFQCTECPAGVMRLGFITYFTWLGDELVTVPNFPAWVCDVCGRREYDSRAVSWLATLLNPTAGQPSKPKHAKRSTPKKRTPIRPGS
jgi:YgiT-type zinc finger domain-containing protein